jgi:hypothetical protein
VIHHRSSRLSLLLPILLCLMPVTAHAGAVLGVTSLSPARNALAASTATSITVGFDEALNASTVTASSVKVFGRWSGPTPGTLSVAGSSFTFRPGRPFFPGEMVTMSVARSVRGQSGSELVGGHAYAFWVRSSPGTGNFVLEDVFTTRLPGEGLVQSYGIYAGDLDADGSPDFTIPNETADDVRVIMNDGCGEFGAIQVNNMPNGTTPSSNEGADYDGDGIMDFAVAQIGNGGMSVFIGVGDGTFAPPVGYASGTNARGLTIMDAEGDGDVDIVLAHRSSSNMGLHRNNGNGTFAAVQLFEGGVAGETAVSAADANNDGYVDLFVGGYNSDNVTVLLNNGFGSFSVSDTQSVAGLNPWMTAVGDVDADGNVDVVTCNAFSGNGAILRGDGSGNLLPATTVPLGSFSLAIDLGDLDGDGDLDLLGSSLNTAAWNCYKNDGLGNFGSLFSLDSSSAASCATLVDYNRDGYVDIVGIDEFDDLIFLYKQDVAPPAGTQPPSCDATLRIDNLAHRAGYGGTAPHLVELGGYLFVGITANASTNWWLTGGLPFEPGVNSPFGLYNLASAPIILLNGTTDAMGESLLSVNVSLTAPAGIGVALQVFAAKAGSYVLSNPEVVQFTP